MTASSKFSVSVTHLPTPAAGGAGCTCTTRWQRCPGHSPHLGGVCPPRGWGGKKSPSSPHGEVRDMTVPLCLWSCPACHVRGLSRGQCPQQRTPRPGRWVETTPQLKLEPGTGKTGSDEGGVVPEGSRPSGNAEFGAVDATGGAVS